MAETRNKLINTALYLQGLEYFISCYQEFRSTEAAEEYVRTALHQAMLVPEACYVYTSRLDFDSKRELMSTSLMKRALDFTHVKH